MTALVNPVLLAAVLIALAGPHQRSRTDARGVIRRAASPIALSILTLAMGASVAARAVLGHTAPGDFVQEVVKIFERGRALFMGWCVTFGVLSRQTRPWHLCGTL